MANSKISALTSATTPLAGTEVLPIVQSSTTKQVAISDVTAGRAVSALSYVTTGGTGNGQITITKNSTVATENTAGLAIQASATNAYTEMLLGTDDAIDSGYIQTAGKNTSWTSKTLVLQPNGGNVKIGAGNVVQGTAAKGFNFTANTPVAGMTSQLLNWYEEGTWTPAQGGGLTVVGAFSSTGKYTRIGREVRVSGTVTGATSVSVTAAGVITTNLPFTVGTAGHGNVTNAALTSFAAIICTSTNITSAGAIAATGTLTFSATYFV